MKRRSEFYFYSTILLLLLAFATFAVYRQWKNDIFRNERKMVLDYARNSTDLVIAHISDTHGDRWRYTLFLDFCKQTPIVDMALHTGDVGNSYQDSIEWYLYETNRVRNAYFIPGNHDLTPPEYASKVSDFIKDKFIVPQKNVHDVTKFGTFFVETEKVGGQL